MTAENLCSFKWSDANQKVYFTKNSKSSLFLAANIFYREMISKDYSDHMVNIL